MYWLRQIRKIIITQAVLFLRNHKLSGNNPEIQDNYVLVLRGTTSGTFF